MGGRGRPWSLGAVGVVLALLTGCTTSITGTAAPAETRPALVTITTPVAPPEPVVIPSVQPTTAEPTVEPTVRPEPEPLYPEPEGPPAIPDAPDPLPDPFAPLEEGVDLGEYDTAPLLQELTDALQADDEDTFLARFDGEAHRRAWFWLRNMRALGMSTGAVSTTPGLWNLIPVDDAGSGWLFNVELGAHLPGDGVDEAGLPIVSTSTYYWLIHVDPETWEPTVVDWVSIDRAPWDCLCSLYVADTGDGLLAGYPDEADLVDTQAAALDAAVDWTEMFFADVLPETPIVGPAVAFTSGERDRWRYWFEALDSEDSHLSDEMDVAAFVVSLDRYTGDDPDVSDRLHGYGSRMVLGDVEDDLESILVHELIHYYLNPLYGEENYAPGDDSVATEGLARMIQQVYWSGPEDGVEGQWWIDPVGTYQDEWTRTGFTEDFADQLPDEEQMRGADAWFWYQVAASVFGYLEQAHGMKTAVLAGLCVYDTGAELFDCVADPETGEWLDPEELEAGWVAWVHEYYLGSG